MVQTVEQLADRFSGQLPARMLSALRDNLLASRSYARSEAETATATEAAIHELTEHRTAIDRWDFNAEGWGAIQDGLRRTYRHGRKAFQQARAVPSTRHLHEWRKRVKDHWYHLRLLTAVCGPVVGGASQEADRLSDLLGEEHDLAVLMAALGDAHADPSVDVQYLSGLIDRRRKELQREAGQLGARLFAEKPASFERRLRSYWKAGSKSSNLHTRSE
jgi:CHAD domain-containing protein